MPSWFILCSPVFVFTTLLFLVVSVVEATSQMGRGRSRGTSMTRHLCVGVALVYARCDTPHTVNRAVLGRMRHGSRAKSAKMQPLMN